MKKIIYVLPLALVTIFGFALNGNYYQYYFNDANYPGHMPLYMALFFISSELILWAFSNKKNFVSVLLKYGLVLFSVFATLSSQFTSTSQQVSESAQIVYDKIDNTSDIERYEEQIRIQDDRINSIFTERREKSYYGLTDAEMDFAQSEKARYENLLSEIKKENKKEIETVFITKSIYGWFASDLPRIFKSGMNEEFIRVIFQLFSSFILAAMSPVCISLIRTIKPDVVKKKPVKKNKFNLKKWFKKHQAPVLKSEISPKLPKVETKTEIPPVKPPNQDPEIIPEPKPIKNELSKIDRRNILKMLLWDFDDKRRIAPPEEAEQRFIVVHNDRPEIKAYKKEECKKIYDLLLNKRTAGKNKKEIIEEIIG